MVCAAAGACAPADASVELESSQAAIVNGHREFGRPSVVFLYNDQGGACTASIISPRVVLTAKHCVTSGTSIVAGARHFQVYVGPGVNDGFTKEYRVAEVRVAEGGFDASDGSDVALLILSTPADEEPMPYARTSPRALAGQTITAVGYGQTPSGRSGTKFTTTARVDGVENNLVAVRPAVCPGDSGGPLLGPDGLIYGVASVIYSENGAEPVCGTAPGIYTGIFRFLAWIDATVEETGTCVRRGDEVCNGIDDDCNGEVDEICSAFAESCTSNDQCATGLCTDSPRGAICTRTCDPSKPQVGCGTGAYCASFGGECGGVCLPGTAGTMPLGAACTADTECASLLCVDPGDGRRRCLTPCRFDAADCLFGEACAALPGSCGSCVDADIVVSAAGRGLGEPCDESTQCHSAMCADDGSARFCTQECTTDEECGAAFHCRSGQCARGGRGGVGTSCLRDGDCADGGFCATRNGLGWCTRECGESTPCPTDFTCEPAGDVSVCAPAKRLLGESCSAAEDCLSGLCAAVAGQQRCTQLCTSSATCPASFECVYSGEGAEAACVASAVANAPRGGGGDGGGCNIAAGARDRSSGALGVFTLAAIATVLARFRARGRATKRAGSR